MRQVELMRTFALADSSMKMWVRTGAVRRTGGGFSEKLKCTGKPEPASKNLMKKRLESKLFKFAWLDAIN